MGADDPGHGHRLRRRPDASSPGCCATSTAAASRRSSSTGSCSACWCSALVGDRRPRPRPEPTGPHRLRAVTTVILLRHGRTTANTGGVLAGWTPGRAARRDRARRRCRRWRSGWRRCRSPPSSAARWSAAGRPPTPSSPGRDLEVQTDDRLGEARYGDWTGRPIKELVKEPLWKVVQQHPSAAVFPGPEGEGLAQTQARAVAAVREWNAKLGPRRRLAGLQPRRRHQGDPGRRAGPAPGPVPADRRRPGVDLGGHLHRDPAVRRPGQRHRRRRLRADPAAASKRRRRKASSDAVVGGGAGATV